MAVFCETQAYDEGLKHISRCESRAKLNAGSLEEEVYVR